VASVSIEALVSIISASTVASASQDGAGAAASAAGVAASDRQKSEYHIFFFVCLNNFPLEYVFCHVC